MGVLDLAAFAENGVGLVEEQDRAAVLGLAENALEVFLGLADELADQVRQLDLVEVQPQLAGDHLGRHGFAGPRRTGKQDSHPVAGGELLADPPFAEHLRTHPDRVDDFLQHLTLIVGQDDV